MKEIMKQLLDIVPQKKTSLRERIEWWITDISFKPPEHHASRWESFIDDMKSCFNFLLEEEWEKHFFILMDVYQKESKFLINDRNSIRLVVKYMDNGEPKFYFEERKTNVDRLDVETEYWTRLGFNRSYSLNSLTELDTAIEFRAFLNLIVPELKEYQKLKEYQEKLKDKNE